MEQKKGRKTRASQLKNDSIFIKVKHELVNINIQDILFLEAANNYAKVHTIEKRHMLSQTLKSNCENLPGSMFFKTHRSYVINKSDSILPKSVMIGDNEISLSEVSRKALLDQIKTWYFQV
ncbi:MAG: DNA-binding LytR/AlgR family response regulator [Crocinitomix sp.]